MKKNKLIILILLVVVFTGCEINYGIEFVDNKIIEETIILDDIKKINDKVIYEKTEGDEYGEVPSYRELLDEEFKSESYSLIKTDQYKYKKTKILNEKYFGISQKYEFDVINYKDSSNANMCYKFFKFYSLGDLYILSTNKEFSCFSYKELDSVTIHLKSNHEVKETNAHKVDGYNYYWYLKDGDNIDNSIHIEFYKDKYVSNYENKVLYVSLGIIGVAILIIIVIIGLRRNSKKKNEI